MSQPVTGPDAPTVPPADPDLHAEDQEREETAVLPAPWDADAPAPAGHGETRGPNRAVAALSAVVLVLLVAAGVLTALVVDTRSDAADLAAGEAAEDREQAARLQGVADQRRALDQRISDAETSAAAAEGRIAAAESGQRAAQEAAAAQEQAEAEATAADEQTFVEALRATETMTSVSDEELLSRGRDVCGYLDSTAGTYSDVSDAFDRAAETYAIDEAILLVTAATSILCPEYGS